MDKKGQSGKLRRQYYKCLAQGVLQSVQQKPDVLSNLYYYFNKAHRSQCNSINHFILNCESPNARFQAIAFRWFKVFGFLKNFNIRRGDTTIHKLNLTELGIRKEGFTHSWEEEFCELFADIQQKSFKIISNDKSQLLHKTIYDEKAIIREVKNARQEIKNASWKKRGKLQRKLARAEMKLERQRAKTQMAYLEKLSQINSVMQWEE